MIDILKDLGVAMILIASDLGAFLIIWYCARKDIKEYLNDRKN